MRNATSMKMQEWLDELESGQPKHEADGFTVVEMADKLGLCESSIQGRLRKAHRAGRLQFVGKRSSTRMDGVRSLIPVYRILAGPAKRR